MSLEINTEDFWKEIDKRVVEHRIEKKLMSEEITKLREQVAAQAAVIELLKSALTYVIEDLELRASLKWDEDERDVVDIGNGAYTQAKEALAIPTDSTQILDEVRRAERDRVAEFILRTDLGGIPKNWQGFAADGPFKYAEAIRAME